MGFFFRREGSGEKWESKHNVSFSPGNFRNLSGKGEGFQPTKPGYPPGYITDEIVVAVQALHFTSYFSFWKVITYWFHAFSLV